MLDGGTVGELGGSQQTGQGPASKPIFVKLWVRKERDAQSRPQYKMLNLNQCKVDKYITWCVWCVCVCVCVRACMHAYLILEPVPQTRRVGTVTADVFLRQSVL